MLTDFAKSDTMAQAQMHMQTEEVASCMICAEDFNKTTRRAVECFRCHKEVCRSCVERFLLGQVHDPHCMFPDCGVAWDRMFLGQEMTAVFMTKAFAKHRETVLYDRERALLPDAMPLVEMEQRASELEDHVRDLTIKMNRLRDQHRTAVRNLRTLRGNIERVYNGAVRAVDVNAAGAGAEGEGAGAGAGAEGAGRSVSHYRRACSRDGCHGFINSHTGHCASCNRHTCRQCNTLLPEDDEARTAHECVEADLLQWQEIQRSTRPCPGCATRIMKTTGCDQMWCPQCHTAFRWSTGQIERGAIHNPHYYEWMFAQNQRGPAERRRDADDLAGGVCVEGDLPTTHMVRRALQHQPDVPMDTRIIRFHRTVSHYANTVIQTADELRRRNHRKQMVARVKYLGNQMTEAQFRNRLQRLDKEVSKAVEYHRVLDTFRLMATDQFQRLCGRDTTKNEFLANMDRIMDITADAVAMINSRYKSALSNIILQ